jgi:hypothetical protein
MRETLNLSLTRVSFNGRCEPFTDATRHNFWPKPGSALLGHVDSNLAPVFDFNGTKRPAPFDVGAYESNGGAQNPGWAIGAGFKR